MLYAFYFTPEFLFPTSLAVVILIFLGYIATVLASEALAKALQKRRVLLRRVDKKCVKKAERKKVFKRLRDWQRNARLVAKQKERTKRNNRSNG